MGTTPRNFMSYSLGCRERFTKGQAQRMLYILTVYRKKLSKALGSLPCYQHVSVQSLLNLFPNPASTSVNVAYGSHGSFYLRDMCGRIVLSVPLQPYESNITLDLAAFAPGMYFYTYETAENNRQDGKLVVTK
jgi:hypothetical protein